MGRLPGFSKIKVFSPTSVMLLSLLRGSTVRFYLIPQF
jgi:hypothetical protein